MNLLRTNIILFLSVASIVLCSGQQNVDVDLSVRYQTIQGFGASDAWNFDPVGKFWDIEVKEQIAELLFSTEIEDNDPNGIGLSRWRFNIGAGSAEQGADSNIDKEERRSECFIENVEEVNGEEVVTYNWNKQIGQQWFLNAARDYDVSQLVAFVNSPPRFYTKNGRTNSDNSNRFGTTNLGTSNYNRFTDFMVTVLKHFADEGITFSQISPINEPQYEWNSGQEGCPWKHGEVYTLVDKLNRDILAAGLDTKILLSEAGDYRYLSGNKDDDDKSEIIDNYFDPTSQYYMGNFSQVLNGIGGHSYWVNSSDSQISSVRETVREKANEQGNIELYQTEYNLLNQHYDDKLLNAIFLAKIIYTDLEIAGVSIWDYWTAIERERWDQKNRFYLLRLNPDGGNYASLNNSGTIQTDKNLWALGNFSRFIRPGYERVKTSGAADLAGLMGVSFVAPDNSELITVYVNWSDNSIDIKENLTNLPDDIYIENAEVFVTNVNNDLRDVGDHALTDSYSVPTKSIVTFRIPLWSEEPIFDCADVNHGTAFLDVCNTCVGGTTGKEPCQIPYGSILPIPGVIEAEFFDQGGELISYHDLTIENQGSDFRTEEAVDIDLSNGVYSVGWTQAEEWMEYKIEVLETGLYECLFTVASSTDNGSIHLELDDVPLGDAISIPNKRSSNWVQVASNDLSLTAGEYVLKVVTDQGGFNFDKMEFEKSVISGVDDEETNQVIIYPNPCSETLTIRLKNSLLSKVEVINSLGQIVETRNSSEENLEIDLADFSAGVYLVRITNKEGVVSKEIVKK